jgi:hypothetical protein
MYYLYGINQVSCHEFSISRNKNPEEEDWLLTTKINTMKRCFTLLTVMLFTLASWAQNADYLLKKDFQSEKKKMSDGIDVAKKAGVDAKKIATKQLTTIDSLIKIQAANEKVLVQTNDSLQKTAARFNDLDVRLTKNTSSTQNLLMMAVIVIAILFLLFLALVFFMKSKTDEKIRELAEENMQLGESIKQDFIAIREDIKKSAATLNARVGSCEEKQKSFATELEEVVDKVVKDQATLKKGVDERFNEFSAQLNAEKDDHKTLHQKIESDVKGLRSLHVKDVEEIRAKL